MIDLVYHHQAIEAMEFLPMERQEELLSLAIYDKPKENCNFIIYHLLTMCENLQNLSLYTLHQSSVTEASSSEVFACLNHGKKRKYFFNASINALSLSLLFPRTEKLLCDPRVYIVYEIWSDLCR
jgi:hypothetical protein